MAKKLKKLTSLILALLMLAGMATTAFASDAADGTADSAETESAEESNQIKLSEYGLNFTLPAEYYFCYDDNVEDFKDYFQKIGWDYDSTVSTMKQQGIELFGFSGDNTKEFYVIVEDDFDYYDGINLKECNEGEYTLAVDRYVGSYFGEYSMLDTNERTNEESDQALYLVSTYDDYTGSSGDSSSSVVVAEYWTTLNGYSFRFLMYDAESLYGYEEILAELKTIMDTVTFDKVLTQDEVKANVKAEKTAETLKIVFVALATLAVIAVIVVIVIVAVRSGKKRKAKAAAEAKAASKDIRA